MRTTAKKASVSATKLFVLFCFCWLLSMGVFAQVYDYVNEDSVQRRTEKPEEQGSGKEKNSLRERLFFGGNGGLQLGNIIFIDVSPLAGYRLTPEFSLGAGLSWQYFQDRRFVNNFSSTVLGGRVFARYDISQYFFPWAEYEFLNYRFRDPFGRETPRQWFTAALVGGGVGQPIGRGGGIYALVLYNLTWQPGRSMYASPWVFRVGFTF